MNLASALSKSTDLAYANKVASSHELLSLTNESDHFADEESYVELLMAYTATDLLDQNEFEQLKNLSKSMAQPLTMGEDDSATRSADQASEIALSKAQSILPEEEEVKSLSSLETMKADLGKLHSLSQDFTALAIGLSKSLQR
jgi:hypothetical protein